MVSGSVLNSPLVIVSIADGPGPQMKSCLISGSFAVLCYLLALFPRIKPVLYRYHGFVLCNAVIVRSILWGCIVFSHQVQYPRGMVAIYYSWLSSLIFGRLKLNYPRIKVNLATAPCCILGLAW